MKTLLIILLMIPIQAQQYQLDIHNLIETQRDGLFYLKNKTDLKIGTIDCFSFITGVTPAGALNSFYLYPSECEEIISYLFLWTNENDYGCLELDYETMNWDLSKACND